MTIALTYTCTYVHIYLLQLRIRSYKLLVYSGYFSLIELSLGEIVAVSHYNMAVC